MKRISDRPGQKAGACVGTNTSERAQRGLQLQGPGPGSLGHPLLGRSRPRSYGSHGRSEKQCRAHLVIPGPACPVTAMPGHRLKNPCLLSESQRSAQCCRVVLSHPQNTKKHGEWPRGVSEYRAAFGSTVAGSRPLPLQPRHKGAERGVEKGAERGETRRPGAKLSLAAPESPLASSGKTDRKTHQLQGSPWLMLSAWGSGPPAVPNSWASLRTSTSWLDHRFQTNVPKVLKIQVALSIPCR